MKRQNLSKPTFARTSKRAHILIECMLKEMQLALCDPARLEAPRWAQLFGTKDSMVVNVQKLIAAMAALPGTGAMKDNAKANNREDVSLSEEEVRLLTEWLADDKNSA